MKLNKKKVLVTSLAVSLIAILSFGTIAWFSDSDSVTNKFMVATSTEEPDDIFSVEVMEQVDKDGDGDYDGNDATVFDGFTYENILPGDKLVKRPWVHNTGSYDQYIRVKVIVDHAQEWSDMGANVSELLDVDTSKWTLENANPQIVDNKVTYVYYYNGILAPTKMVRVFGIVEIPSELTQDDMAKFENGVFTMDIVAEAVQTENVGDDVFEAFATVMGN